LAGNPWQPAPLPPAPPTPVRALSRQPADAPVGATQPRSGPERAAPQTPIAAQYGDPTPYAVHAPQRPLARQAVPTIARASAPISGETGAASGGDADAIYDEVLRRVRQEQEQLGQLIDHPF
jgi:hypothetical protein